MLPSIALQQKQFNIICLHTFCSIWPIDRILSGASTPGESGPGGNGNEGVLHIPQISKNGASLSDGLMSYNQDTHWRERVLPHQQKCNLKMLLSFNWNHFEMRLLNLRSNFYLLRTFCPHFGSFFCVVSSFTTFRPNFTCGLLQVIFLSDVAVNHLKKARGEIWPKRSERRNNTKKTKQENQPRWGQKVRNK